MSFADCIPEKISKLAIAVFFAVGGLGTTVISITFIPVLGLFLAVPVLLLSGYFFFSRLNSSCKLP